MTDSEKRALRTLVMHPRIASQLDDEQLATLRALPRIGELFAEVVDHARALGEGAEFRLLSDVLRTSSNGATYEEIFREILDYDENVRDLLLQNPEDETVSERQREQERIAGRNCRRRCSRCVTTLVATGLTGWRGNHLHTRGIGRIDGIEPAADRHEASARAVGGWRA